jgi:hypothetical protein
MYSSAAKIIFVLSLGLMSICAIAQDDQEPDMAYQQEYQSFVESYNAMVDVMLNMAADHDAFTISAKQPHIPYLRKAKLHLNNCLSIAPADKQIKTMLIGFQTKLEFLEESK